MRNAVLKIREIAETLATQNLQTLTPRYIINSIYGEKLSEIAEEYETITSLIERFPILIADTFILFFRWILNACHGETVSPNLLLTIFRLYEEAITYTLAGVGNLLKMSDQIAFHYYSKGLQEGTLRQQKYPLFTVVSLNPTAQDNQSNEKMEPKERKPSTRKGSKKVQGKGGLDRRGRKRVP